MHSPKQYPGFTSSSFSSPSCSSDPNHNHYSSPSGVFDSCPRSSYHYFSSTLVVSEVVTPGVMTHHSCLLVGPGVIDMVYICTIYFCFKKRKESLYFRRHCTYYVERPIYITTLSLLKLYSHYHRCHIYPHVVLRPGLYQVLV